MNTGSLKPMWILASSESNLWVHDHRRPTTPMINSTNIAGILGLVKKKVGNHQGNPGQDRRVPIRWTPSTMKESPRPSIMPRTTGLVASLAIGRMSPREAPASSQKILWSGPIQKEPPGLCPRRWPPLQ